MYRLDKRDDILSYRDPVDGATQAVNAGRTRHHGIEVGLNTSPFAWLQLQAAYSAADHLYEDWLLDPARKLDYSGRHMETAPRDVANVLLTVSPSRWSQLSLETVHLGRYWMDAANTNEYPGHTLLNLRAQVTLRGGLQLFARLLNVANERFAESAAFTEARGREYAPGLPRTAYIGVKLGWPR